MDQAKPDHVSIAISAAGVFSTQNAGKTWSPMNSNLKNILAKYDPKMEKYLEVGQRGHYLVAAGGRHVFTRRPIGAFTAATTPQNCGQTSLRDCHLILAWLWLLTQTIPMLHMLRRLAAASCAAPRWQAECLPYKECR
ncbi:MAG: hypothetical protein EXR59_00565 [Dehalococcoidia bacterium]|nr:hypothetical protein [Dehalococcoidia bacterium]